MRRLALFTIFVTFTLLILGGVVHNTQSSLACPDWPLCYGQFFPKMEGGILIEHSHRLLASLVGLLTIGLVAMSFRNRKEDPFTFRFANLLLFMVILQGVLGGITVIYRLPTIVSTSHLALSMIYFCSLIFFHHHVANKEKGPLFNKEESKWLSQNWKAGLRQALLLGGILLYAQMVLGAFMRHSGAGAACGLGTSNSLLCMDTAYWVHTLWPSLSPAQLHMTHRIGGLIVTLVAFYLGLKLFLFFLRAPFLRPNFRSFGLHSLLWPIVVLVQAFLGIATVMYNMQVVPTTAHLAGGALSLAVVWSLWLRLGALEKEVFPQGVHTLLSDLFGLTKPKLSALVMMTAFVGLLLAPGEVGFFKAAASLGFIYLVVLGAGVLNCYIERDTDRLMERTKERSLPAGRLHPRIALSFGVFLLLLGVPGLVMVANLTTALLALLAAVLYLFFYTPMKRKSEMAVFVGAIPGAIPPLLGWTTVMGEFGPMGWSLFLILLVWQLPHFFAISIYHAKDYRAADIKVFPNQFGDRVTLFNIMFFTLVLFGVSILPFHWAGASQAYSYSAWVLGGVFSALALEGLFLKEPLRRQSWAKRYFWGSIFYLPLLLGAMLFFK